MSTNNVLSTIPLVFSFPHQLQFFKVHKIYIYSVKVILKFQLPIPLFKLYQVHFLWH